MTDTDTLASLTAQVESVLHSLTWQGIAEAAAEASGEEFPAYVDGEELQELPAYVDGEWVDEDGDIVTADEAFHAHTPDSPAMVWMDDQLEATVFERRNLATGERTVDHVSVLCTYGGPNIWADWDGSRWHVQGHWGSEEVHRYMSRDDIGVGDYLDEVVNGDEY